MKPTHHLFLFLLLLPLLTQCNIWDNLFSKPRSLPQIELDTDFHTEFILLWQGRQLNVNFDYSVGKNTATIEVYTLMQILFFVTKMELGVMQVDFKQGTAVLNTPLECRNYVFEVPESPINSLTHSPKRSLIIHYLNLLFQYDHTSQNHHFFLFNPDLLSATKRQDIPHMGIWIDSSGKIDQIMVNEANIAFVRESDVKTYGCEGEPERLDREALQKIVGKVLEFLPR